MEIEIRLFATPYRAIEVIRKGRKPGHVVAPASLLDEIQRCALAGARGNLDRQLRRQLVFVDQRVEQFAGHH